MSTEPRQMPLGAFIMATSHHLAAWRHPQAEARAGHDIAHRPCRNRTKPQLAARADTGTPPVAALTAT